MSLWPSCWWRYETSSPPRQTSSQVHGGRERTLQATGELPSKIATSVHDREDEEAAGERRRRHISPSFSHSGHKIPLIEGRTILHIYILLWPPLCILTSVYYHAFSLLQDVSLYWSLLLLWGLRDFTLLCYFLLLQVLSLRCYHSILSILVEDLTHLVNLILCHLYF